MDGLRRHPKFARKGQRDNAAYELMEARGELRTYPAASPR